MSDALLAQLDQIAAGRTPDQFIADRMAETSALLAEIRADIAALREESSSRNFFSDLLRTMHGMPNTTVKVTAAAQADSSSKPQGADAEPPDTQVRPDGLECHPETPSEPSQADSPKHPEAPSDSGGSP